jgi:hypothetical protein
MEVEHGLAGASSVLEKVESREGKKMGKGREESGLVVGLTGSVVG